MSRVTPDDFLDVDGLDNEQLLEDIRSLIRAADANKPRSLQRALGPSEVGHMCERRLAYGQVAARRPSNTPKQAGLNRFSDPLSAIMGTAMHAWLEDAVRSANEQLGRVRWIPEQRVEIRPGLAGTCDLYDADTLSVLDWKVPGKTRHDKYKKYGPSNTYRAQAHLYGAGYQRSFGLPVKYVGIVFLSRTGGLRDTFLWREEYNQALVDEVLARLDRVDIHIAEKHLMTDPKRFLQVPITPDGDCSATCPWYSPVPDDSGYQCPGKA